QPYKLPSANVPPSAVIAMLSILSFGSSNLPTDEPFCVFQISTVPWIRLTTSRQLGSKRNFALGTAAPDGPFDDLIVLTTVSSSTFHTIIRPSGATAASFLSSGEKATS